ncbi:MAG: 3-deoxy-D-manno-octulosonic acid kinase, partial [Pseudomonadota bacterium]
MNNFEVNDAGNHIVAFNKLLCKSFPHHLFDPAYLLANGLLNESVENQQGRGAVKYFNFNGISMVLRHYYRGGWPAKFVSDHYLWLGLQKTRAIQEIKILSELQRCGLPVPEPVAAHIFKSGVNYQADIVTVCIPEAQTLSEILQIKSLEEQVWEKIGKTIRKFH